VRVLRTIEILNHRELSESIAGLFFLQRFSCSVARALRAYGFAARYSAVTTCADIGQTRISQLNETD